MIQLSEIFAQLSKIGVRRTWLSSPEIRQLPYILMRDEKILAFCSGRHHGGFAILAATPIRILLVDKKAFYLTVDDIRYDMIAEVNYNSRRLDATITIFTVGKQHSFTSIREKNLRDLSSYVQKRVMELRHFEQIEQQPQELATRDQDKVIQQPFPARYFEPHSQHDQHYFTFPRTAQHILDDFHDRGHYIARQLRRPAGFTHRVVGATAVRRSFMSKSIIR